MQYPNGGPLTLKTGHLKKINEDKIHHSVTTCKGSSGSPIILLLRDFKIIGIHTSYSNRLKVNFGTSMKYILEDIMKKIPFLIEDIGKWELR